jgi:ankyrin repeat protein
LKNCIIGVLKEEVRLLEDMIIDTEVNMYEMETLRALIQNVCHADNKTGVRRSLSLAIHLISTFGADLDNENTAGRTPLTVAIGRGSISLVRTLISNGADVNKKDTFTNKTPLQYARTHDSLKDTVRSSIIHALQRAGAVDDN